MIEKRVHLMLIWVSLIGEEIQAQMCGKSDSDTLEEDPVIFP